MDWYASLAKPALTPPNWIFGPVWTALYAMMAIAFVLILRSQGKRRNAIILFVLQLAANIAWSFIFFTMHAVGWALLDIFVLIILIALTIAAFRKLSRTAAWLLVPYLAWCAFASYLNLSLWLLNR